MKMMQVLLAAVVLAGVGAAGGCKYLGGPNDNATATLIVSSTSPVTDVPVPAGFSLDAGKSHSAWNPNLKIRTVNHEYKGKDAMMAVVKFYREQLPQHKWSEPILDQQGKRMTLKCSKQKEDLSITIWQGTMDTHIVIKLDPTATSPAK